MKMKALLIIAATLALIAPATFAAEEKAHTTEGAPTSDRTPGKQATTPENQVDTTKSGETSDRTPGRHAEKTGDMSGSTSMQTWDDSYKSTMAQEDQLKGGGASKSK